MEILIKTMSGKTTLSNIRSNTSIYDVKKLIQMKLNIKPLEQYLFFNGKELKDINKLKYYKICDQSTLQLVIRTTPIKIPKSKHSSSFYCEYRHTKMTKSVFI